MIHVKMTSERVNDVTYTVQIPSGALDRMDWKNS